LSIKHLSIRKTGKELFTLVQMDKTQKQVVKRHYSGNLEEVIENLLDRCPQMDENARIARDFGPVLEIINILSQSYPSLNHENFPTSWTDPIELYGCLAEELTRFQIDLNSARKKLVGLIFDRGSEWVWKNRLRLMGETLMFMGSEENRGESADAFQQPP
jgi:hypothetical protein